MDADKRLQTNWNDSLVGQIFKVFLLHKAAGGRDIWFVHQAWADTKVNPWFSGRPKFEDILEGVVTGYIEDYAATIETTKGLEVMLHKAQIPGSGVGSPINELIFVVNQVCGKIFEMNVSISIKINLQPVIRQKMEAVRR